MRAGDPGLIPGRPLSPFHGGMTASEISFGFLSLDARQAFERFALSGGQ